jgi:tetratricopeptide (TPR) repeat protein
MPVAGLGVFEALLAQSWAVRFTNPQEMVHLAEAAVEVAKEFDDDLLARAWGELANAYRTADRLRSAEKAFGQAYALLPNGTGDPYLRARLFDLEASLLGTAREFPLALRRLVSLTNLYHDLGEVHLAGRALVTRALYTSYSGQTEEALHLNADGLDLIDRRGDPVLYMMAVHNHLLFLVDLGSYAQAKRTLFEHRCHLIYRDGVGALRFRGLEGRISYGLGELVSAEIAFRETKEGLAAAGMSFYGALISLELAMVLLSQGKVEEAEQEVIAAREIFLSLEIYRELLGSILYLEECFRRKEVTAELIETTVAFLRRRALEIVPKRPR